MNGENEFNKFARTVCARSPPKWGRMTTSAIGLHMLNFIMCLYIQCSAATATAIALAIEPRRERLKLRVYMRYAEP